MSNERVINKQFDILESMIVVYGPGGHSVRTSLISTHNLMWYNQRQKAVIMTWIQIKPTIIGQIALGNDSYS